jgi:hypothetical protein
LDALKGPALQFASDLVPKRNREGHDFKELAEKLRFWVAQRFCERGFLFRRGFSR